MADITSQTKAESVLISPDGQLSYVGHDCDSIPVHLASQGGQDIRRLDLSFNNIRSLDGIDAFPNLEELVLDNNHLTDQVTFPVLSNLHTLTLNKNKIRHADLYTLMDKLAACTPSLTYLSLLGNQACPNQLSSMDKDDDDYRRYRLYVLYRLPNLKFLDSTQVKPRERLEAKRQGPFLKVVKPSEDPDNVQIIQEENVRSGPYTPLSKNIRVEPDFKATFGKCRYVYYGNHSEGNRFIRNNDL